MTEINFPLTAEWSAIFNLKNTENHRELLNTITRLWRLLNKWYSAQVGAHVSADHDVSIYKAYHRRNKQLQ